MIRILGIDPGSRLTGYGIIEVRSDRSLCIANGCIRVSGDELASRLGEIFAGISDIIEEYQPQEAAIESVFVHRNVDSALKLGQARGAAISAITSRFVPVREYTPAQIKKSVVGKGNASKEQVQHMIMALLRLPGQLQADAADALAVAMCHSHSRGALGQLVGLRGSRRSTRRYPLSAYRSKR